MLVLVRPVTTGIQSQRPDAGKIPLHGFRRQIGERHPLESHRENMERDEIN